MKITVILKGFDGIIEGKKGCVWYIRIRGDFIGGDLLLDKYFFIIFFLKNMKCFLYYKGIIVLLILRIRKELGRVLFLIIVKWVIWVNFFIEK